LHVRDLAAEGDIDGVIRELQNPLEHEDLSVRFVALLYLGKLNAKPAIPHVIRLLDTDPRRDVRARSAKVLAQLGAQEAVPALARALSDEEPAVRFRAAKALGDLGVQDTETLNALERLLDDPVRGVRKAAKRALRRLTPR
jgi:HEAT repeat protein